MLAGVTSSLDKAEKTLTSLQTDYTKLTVVTQFNSEGALPNAVKITLTAKPITTVKALGEYITQMDEKMDTKGDLKQLGTLHGFGLYVRTDTSYTYDGKPEKANAFIVKGDNLTYSYNNGYVAGRSPEVAARQFVRALQKLPSLLENQREKIENLHQQQKLLSDIATKPWSKGDKLQELKAELRQVESRLLTIGQEKEPKKDQQKANQTEKAATKQQDHSIEIA